MSWTGLARKDFEDVIRSWLLWAVVLVFVAINGLLAISAAISGTEDADAVGVYDLFQTFAGELLIPLAALMIGYMAIAGERQSGSLRILFGLSFDRDDVLFGKLASRVLAITVATLVLLGVTALLIMGFTSIDLSQFLQVAALTILYAAAFTAIAVSISALSDSRAKAMGGAVGIYVVFVMLWDAAVALLFRATQGQFPGLEAPAWYFFLKRLNPMTAYRESMTVILDQYQWGLIGSGIVEDIPEEEFTGESLRLSNRVAGELPFYLSGWFSGVILLGWIVLAVGVAYWSFMRADLN